MAIARTGVFVDDYLEYSSTLAAELQRLLSTMRELDERALGLWVRSTGGILRWCGDVLTAARRQHPHGGGSIINQTRDQTRYCVSYGSKKINHEDGEAALEKLKKEIEANQESALSLCTEKVLLAQQAYDLIESHVKRLDEDLNQFAEDLKQEGKISPDEPAILPSLPMMTREEKRKAGYITPQSKRFRERDWERDMDLELMPPPGTHKKIIPASIDVDQPIDPDEPTYCVCHQVSFGDMIACDNENCEGGEWFHYTCVGLTPETRFKGKWFCPTCRQQQRSNGVSIS